MKTGEEGGEGRLGDFKNDCFDMVLHCKCISLYKYLGGVSLESRLLVRNCMILGIFAKLGIHEVSHGRKPPSCHLHFVRGDITIFWAPAGSSSHSENHTYNKAVEACKPRDAMAW